MTQEVYTRSGGFYNRPGNQPGDFEVFIERCWEMDESATQAFTDWVDKLMGVVCYQSPTRQVHSYVVSNDTNRVEYFAVSSLKTARGEPEDDIA